MTLHEGCPRAALVQGIQSLAWPCLRAPHLAWGLFILQPWLQCPQPHCLQNRCHCKALQVQTPIPPHQPMADVPVHRSWLLDRTCSGGVHQGARGHAAAHMAPAASSRHRVPRALAWWGKQGRRPTAASTHSIGVHPGSAGPRQGGHSARDRARRRNPPAPAALQRRPQLCSPATVPAALLEAKSDALGPAGPLARGRRAVQSASFTSRRGQL